MRKVATHALEDGSPAHSFCTLLADLATIVRNTCRAPHAAHDAPTFQITTNASPTQQRALDLVSQIRV